MGYLTEAGISLRGLQAEAVEIERALGWTGPGVDAGSFGDRMALLHSEVSEAFEAFRRWGTADATTPLLDVYTGEVDPAKVPKPEGVGSEFADVLIRLLTECERYGIDIEAEVQRKMAYNRTREHRHGGKAL